MRRILGSIGFVALVATSGAAMGAGAVITAAPAGAAVAAGEPDPLRTFPAPGESRRWGGGEAFGINDAGAIVGETPTDASTWTPFVFEPAAHEMVELPAGPFTWWARPRAINASGTIVGQLNVSDGWIATRPAVWSATVHALSSVGDLGGDFGFAHDISDGGIVVGDASMPRGEDPNVADSHAFVSNPAGGLIDIGTSPGGASSTASGVNEAGLVVGTSEVAGTAPCLGNPAATCGATHAFTYDRHTGVRTDIGGLPGGTSSEATGINESGVVVGSSLVPGPGGTTQTHPFTYDTASGTFTDLGVLGGATVLRATAVNDDGVVVGNSNASGAWAYEPVDGALDAVPGVEHLNDINNHGMAVGTGLVPTGIDEDGVIQPGFVIGAIRVQLQVNPSAPSLVRAASCTGPVDLLWSRPANTGYASTPSYRVYRDGTPIATTTALSLRDLGGAAGASYAIQTVNDAGSSPIGPALVASCSASIAGTVTSEGLPVAGIDVRVYPYGSGPAVTKTTTAADGTYTIPALGPGSYQVRFSSASSTYVLEWNGGSSTQAGAPAVVVSGVVAVVDADLARSGSITGTVTSSGVPVADVDVRVYPTGILFVAAKTRTAADGTYHVDGLAPGTYEVRFSTATGTHLLQWNGGSPTRAGAPPVPVSTTTSATIDASLVAAAVVTGQFFAYDPVTGQPTDARGIDIRIYPVGSPAVAKGVTGPDGRFTVSGFPGGAYRVRVSDNLGRLPGILWLADDPNDDVYLMTPSLAQAAVIPMPAGAVTDVGPFQL